jgi:TRAP-type C4-dicarboxylate transport system permease small subunit
MKLFLVCYTPFHRVLRLFGILLFLVILGLLVYGIWGISPKSQPTLYVRYWTGFCVLVLFWASLAFMELFIIRKHFLNLKEEDLYKILVEASTSKQEKTFQKE